MVIDLPQYWVGFVKWGTIKLSHLFPCTDYLPTKKADFFHGSIDMWSPAWWKKMDRIGASKLRNPSRKMWNQAPFGKPIYQVTSPLICKHITWNAKCPILKAIVAGFRGPKLPKKIGHLAFQVYIYIYSWTGRWWKTTPCPSETGVRFSCRQKTPPPSCQRRRAGFRRREPGAVEAPQSCGRRWLADSEQARVGRGVKLAPR